MNTRRKGNVLVWSETEGWRKALVWCLHETGCAITPGESEYDVMALVSRDGFDVAVIDIEHIDESSIQLVERLTCPPCRAKLIVTAPEPGITTLRERLGAAVYEFLIRPDDLGRLPASTTRAIECQTAAVHLNGHQRRTVPVQAPSTDWDQVLPAFVGATPCVKRVLDLVAQVAPSDMTVLIRGESGTGKDVVARLIHALSPRAATGNFVKINCPTIPDTLLESELFGYEKGAFTGAVSQKPGRFELAEGGTIFLDEIGLMSPSMQSKLLEVIEHKQFVRVGGKGTTLFDGRIIAATSSPLEHMIETGAFRPDLFYRLRQFSITLPALRDRVDDIPLLCEHFLQTCAAKRGFTHTGLPPEVVPHFIRYQWPGNVRELEALVARYALTGDIEPVLQTVAPAVAAPETGPHDDKLEAIERSTILAALVECRWNQRQAASNLGISYSALRRRIAKHHLDETVPFRCA